MGTRAFSNQSIHPRSLSSLTHDVVHEVIEHRHLICRRNDTDANRCRVGRLKAATVSVSVDVLGGREEGRIVLGSKLREKSRVLGRIGRIAEGRSEVDDTKDIAEVGVAAKGEG